VPLTLITHRESPALATYISDSVIKQTFAVHPAKDSSMLCGSECFISLTYFFPSGVLKILSNFMNVSSRARAYY